MICVSNSNLIVHFAKADLFSWNDTTSTDFNTEEANSKITKLAIPYIKPLRKGNCRPHRTQYPSSTLLNNLNNAN